MIDLGTAGETARRQIRLGTGLALAGATAYGINIVGARVAAQMGITGADILVYRGLLLLPLMALIALATGRRLVLGPGERGTVLRFALAAAGTALGYMSSLKYLPVSLAVTIFYTYPLLVILLTPYIDRVRLPLRRWIVALVAFAGVLLAVGPHVSGIDPRGLLLAFAGAACCAGMFIAGSRLTTDSLVTFFWCQLVATPIGLAFAWLSGGLAEPTVILAAALPMAVNVIGYFLGFLLQILAASRLSAASAGLLFLFEPVVAIISAAVVIGEHITALQGAGMLMVVAALAYDLWSGRQKPLPALSAAATAP